MKLTKEQSALLELIKASLFSIKPDIPDNIDWNIVLKLAKKQTVVALVEPVVPISSDWKDLAYQSKAHYMRVYYEQSKLIAKLQEHLIPYIILKGTSAALYYPHPYLRAMGDIDILVRDEHYEQAKKIIEGAGYTFLSEDYRNSSFIKGAMEIELHYRFSSKENNIEPLVKKGLEEAVEYQIGKDSFYGPPVLINGIILLDHIRQHLVRSGLGLRQVIDWMLFVHKKIDDYTWENEFRVLVSDAGLEKLAITVTALCKIYLGLPTVSWCDVADTGLIDSLLKRLFIDGNFGTDRPKTEEIRSGAKRNGLFSYLQHAGQENWTLIQRFPFIQPLSWIYQIGRYTRKGMIEIYHGKNPLKGLKSGADKDRLLEQLGIRL